MPKSQREEYTPYSIFLAGLHFGCMQVAFFFSMQLRLTATYMGYFAVALTWMLGVVLALRLPRRVSLTTALLISTVAYFGYDFCLTIVAPTRFVLIATLPLIALGAYPAGLLFRYGGAKLSPRQLFLNENNGFVLGLAIASLFAIQWGIHFLSYGPLATSVIAWCALSGRGRLAFFWAFVAVIVVTFSQAGAGFFLVLVFLGIAFMLATRPPAAASDVAITDNALDLPLWGLRAVLFISGLNLLLLQFFITREFAVVLSASELAILVVAVAYFAGYSAGYAVSGWLSQRSVRLIAAASFFLHVLMVFGTRFIAGVLLARGFGWITLIGLLFTASFLTSTFYSILLPRLLMVRHNIELAVAYSWDLAGAVTGGLLLLLFAAVAPQFLWPLYFGAMAFLIYVLIRQTVWSTGFVIMAAVVCVFVTVHQQELTKRVTEDFYRSIGFDHPEWVFGGQSFYHAIDVVDTYDALDRLNKKSRVAFINGIKYFEAQTHQNGKFQLDSASLSEFTYFLSELPAKLMAEKMGRKLRVLILGGGSMTTMARVAPYAEKTTLVEIDPLVVEAAKKCWREFNHYDAIVNGEIIIDDAKHYLKTTPEKFDLIIIDVSAPYYLGTALIHSREFFALAKTRLKDDGILAESTQARPNPHKSTAMGMKILAGVREVFPHWRLIDGEKAPRGEHGYVYASAAFPFATKDLVDIMQSDGKYEGTSTYSDKSKYFNFKKVRPYSETGMETLIKQNAARIKNRLGLNDDADIKMDIPLREYRTVQFFQMQSRNKTTRVTLSLSIAFILGITGMSLRKRAATGQRPVNPSP